MTTATPRTGEIPPAAPDAELAALLPRGSRGRTIALLAATALAIAAAWVSPDLLRGDLPTTGSGAWTPIQPQHVVAVTELAAPGFGARHVDSVADVPGAEVVGAWIVPGWPELDPGAWEGSDPVASAAAAMPDADPLPARLTSGRTSSLVVVWRVTSCAALDDDRPLAAVRTLIGTRDVQLEEIAGPGFDRQLLEQEGVCP